MMSNIGSYQKRLLDFDWSIAEKELEYHDGDIINIGWYCSDRICFQGKGDKIALYFENFTGKERKYTFNDIRLASNTIGTLLRNLEIQNGDRICLFMDRVPELYFSFLGILKIGAVAQPLFSAFGDESLYVRLEDAQTRAIITQSKYLPKIRRIRDKLPFLEYIIVLDHTKTKNLENREYAFYLEEIPAVEKMEIFPTKSESPSVLHYTSGTTGQPKGVQHVHYSLISQYLTTKWVLDLQDDDIYWCTADPGIEKYKISMWYSSPTAIRSLMKAGNELVMSYDLSSLRHLASIGEPLNPEAVIWSQRIFGKPFHDTYWQTETGSIMISNFPGMKIKPGSMGKPFPGITGVILDQERFEPIEEAGKIGLIAFKPGWPAMMRGYWNSEEIYKKKFVGRWYLSGDKGTIDNEGYFWFVGRDDDIINTGGHLVSPFEVESALLEHPAVGESAVVSKPDEVNMEVVKAFITLKPGFIFNSELELDIMNFIRKKLSSLAMPQEIEYMDKLPKTRSGKIMRRLLHAKEWGEDTGDISSLEND